MSPIKVLALAKEEEEEAEEVPAVEAFVFVVLFFCFCCGFSFSTLDSFFFFSSPLFFAFVSIFSVFFLFGNSIESNESFVLVATSAAVDAVFPTAETVASFAFTETSATDDPIDFEVSNADDDTDFENSANDDALFEMDSLARVVASGSKETFGI